MQAWRAETDDDVSSFVAAVGDRLETLRPKPGLGLVIAVDGPAGSGKTTLAALIAQHRSGLGEQTVVIHMDDLYDGWHGLDHALEQRVLAQLLRPLAAGRPARWQRYDWAHGRFGEWEEVAPADHSRRLLVLEGCGSGAQAHAAYLGLLVWVEARRATRVERGLRRDGPDVASHWAEWMVDEQRHFDANQTSQRADLTLDTDLLAGE